MNGAPGRDGGGGGGGGSIVIRAGTNCDIAEGTLQAHGGDVVTGSGVYPPPSPARHTHRRT